MKTTCRRAVADLQHAIARNIEAHCKARAFVQTTAANPTFEKLAQIPSGAARERTREDPADFSTAAKLSHGRRRCARSRSGGR